MGNAPAIVCEACGKRFRWLPQLIGKQVKCTCGQMIRVDAQVLETASVGASSGAAAAPSSAGVKPQVVSKELLNRLGVPPSRTRVSDHDKGEIERQRKELEALAKGNFFRDWILPIPIIAVGIGLIFVQQMQYTKYPAHSVVQAIPLVALRTVGSAGFVVAAMFAAMFLFEVRFLGEIKHCILRFCAIAVGPAAIYPILSFVSGGELAGALTAVFATVGAYAVLFWALMRMDLKDTSVCVVLTWINVAIVNYLIYRAEGMIQM
jgi:hypothetical protein